MHSDSPALRRNRRPGRPSALTPDVEAMILNAVRCGSSYRSACVAAGVGERSFHRWKSRGQEEGAPTEYRQFWQALTRAEHEGQIARLAEGGLDFLTVELNTGQMVEDVRLAVNGRSKVEFAGYPPGYIPSPDEVYEEIMKRLKDKE